jgi:ATP-binding cassette subfamily B multidrug efflux pump
MLRFFERRLEPTRRSPETPPPVLGSPHAVLRFYWHFVRQIPGPIAAVFTTSFFVAVTDAAIPVCIGRIVSLVSAQDPQTIWADPRPDQYGALAEPLARGAAGLDVFPE